MFCFLFKKYGRYIALQKGKPSRKLLQHRVLKCALITVVFSVEISWA